MQSDKKAFYESISFLLCEAKIWYAELTINFCLTKKQQRLVLKHLPLVKKVLWQMNCYPPKGWERQDLEQVGRLGLIEAAVRHDGRSQDLFLCYARERIRGAILDELRKQDKLTRGLREKHRLIEKTKLKMQQRCAKEISSREVAQVLGFKMQEFFSFQRRAKAGVFFAHHEIFRQKTYPEAVSLEETMFQKQLFAILKETIQGFSKDEQTLLGLYYEQEKTLKKIGQILGKTESRICQIHKDLLKRLSLSLRNRLQADLECEMSAFIGNLS